MLLKGLHETAGSLESENKDTHLNVLQQSNHSLKSSTNFPEVHDVHAYAVTLFTSVWKQWISMLEVFRQSQFSKMYYCIQICREKMLTSTMQHMKPKSRMCCSSCFKSVLNMDNSTASTELILRFKVTLSFTCSEIPQHPFHDQKVRKHLQPKQNKVLSNAPRRSYLWLKTPIITKSYSCSQNGTLAEVTVQLA